MGSLNDETRSTRGWWAATRSQGVTVSDWPRRLFRLHVIHFLNFLCHLLSLCLFRAFHSKISSQKSGFAESVRFYLRLADDIGQAARTTSQFLPTGRHIPYSAVLSVEQPQWSHIDLLRTVNSKWSFFFSLSHVPSHQWSATTSKISSAHGLHPHPQTLEIQSQRLWLNNFRSPVGRDDIQPPQPPEVLQFGLI